jgi:hypothetical protein
MTDLKLWTSGCGRLNLEMTLEQAQSCSHPGDCEVDVICLLREPEIAAQVAEWDPAILAEELRGYGAWDGDELADHDANVSRMVWLAAGDIVDGRDG